MVDPDFGRRLRGLPQTTFGEAAESARHIAIWGADSRCQFTQDQVRGPSAGWAASRTSTPSAAYNVTLPLFGSVVGRTRRRDIRPGFRSSRARQSG